MNNAFPSPSDPLLTPSATTSNNLAAATNDVNDNIPSASSLSQKFAPEFTCSPMDSPATRPNIKFKIGDTGTGRLLHDNLYIFQQEPVSSHSPLRPPERMHSLSSISASTECSSEPTTTIYKVLSSDAKQPDQVLIELYDLKLENEHVVSGCWEETARWIKYEEDVEGVDHHWGLPHVSFLSFHALLQLRKCIAKGVVLLDLLDVPNFVALTELIGAVIASESYNNNNHNHTIHEQVTRRMAKILQLRHRHVEGGASRRMSRISTAASNLVHLLERGGIPTLQRERNKHTAEVPRRSISAAPLNYHATHIEQQNLAHYYNHQSVKNTETVQTHHVLSFANSPPTITEVEECCSCESANNTIQSGNIKERQQLQQRLRQARSSTPDVMLTCNKTPNAVGASVMFKEHNIGARTVEKEKAPETLILTAMEERGRNSSQKCLWRQGKHHNRGDVCKETSEINVATNATLLASKCEGDQVLQKLVKRTELVQVLVGEVHWLKKAHFVMLRLAKPTPMPELADNHIPVRIIFVILGPSLSDGCYHELGRSLAALMSNKHFKTIAYGARDKSQLIKGLDSFLDGSVVIPPGEIDSKRLISGDELKKALRRRKKEMNKHKVSPTSNGDERHGGNEVILGTNKNNGVETLSLQKELPLLSYATSPAAVANGHGRYSPVQTKQYHKNNDVAPLKVSASPSKIDSKKRHRCPLFKGVYSDIKNRLPFYWSDIRDAANFQCLTSVVFMFFASFVPAISFGGLMGSYTDETMGTIETLFAQCICGILWGLFSVQPLLIMSATGPVLIFEASLYTFCESLHLDFLTIRFYAGLFIFMIAICISALDGARLLVYVTRFTEDIFTTLISAIFIAESLHFVWHTFKENPVEDYNFYERIHANCHYTVNGTSDGIINPNTTNGIMTVYNPHIPFDMDRVGNSSRNLTILQEAHNRLMNAMAESGSMTSTAMHRHYMAVTSCAEAEPNTALLTAIIVVSTFILAFMLKKLRESFYLGKHLRRAIGDFGVLISITIIALIVHLCIPDPYLQRLEMPDHINFTNPEKRGHGLIIQPKLGIDDWYGLLIAFIAALLVFILLFVETEITELLLTRKERGCKKSSGMHWDLVLVGLCAFLCSIFGLPWMCAAAVQSLAHCSSLTVMKKTAPGARPEVDHVIEQRITTIGVSILIGMIAFGGNYLRLPLASLFGVFLYLGVMNLCGVQLMQRVVLFFIPEKYFPDTPYTQEMSIWRMHLYTWIQLICLFLVYTVKYFKKTALVFPFVLMLFIIFRQLILPKIFRPAELKAIDGEEQSDDDEWIDKEFYDNAPIPV